MNTGVHSLPGDLQGDTRAGSRPIVLHHVDESGPLLLLTNANPSKLLIPEHVPAYSKSLEKFSWHHQLLFIIPTFSLLTLSDFFFFDGSKKGF
jgi:hypothetical protein